MLSLQSAQHALDLLDLLQVLLLELALEAVLVTAHWAFPDFPALLLGLSLGQEDQFGPAYHEIGAVGL